MALFDVDVTAWCVVSVEAISEDDAIRKVTEAYRAHKLMCCMETEMNAYVNYEDAVDYMI